MFRLRARIRHSQSLTLYCISLTDGMYLETTLSAKAKLTEMETDAETGLEMCK